MKSLHDAHGLERVLPQHLENVLSERDQLLNRLPPRNLLEIYEAGESRLFVDRALALSAAASGVPVSPLATACALAVPIFAVAAIILIVFVSWQSGVAVVLAAIVSFKASRHMTKRDVSRAALTDDRLLTLLMRKGAVWFEMADR